MSSKRIRIIATGLALGLIHNSAAWAQGAEESAEHARNLPGWQLLLEDILTMDLFNITLWRLGLAALLLLLGFSLRGYLLDRVLSPLKNMAARTHTKIDDELLRALRTPLGWVLNLIAVYLALVAINPPDSIMMVAVLLMKTLGTVLVAWVLLRLIDVIAEAFVNVEDGEGRSEMEKQLVPLIVRVLRMVLFIFVSIAIIQQWGYDVTSLIAGLGIGGLAFALAAKPTLENWFGSVMIFSDRPFAVGDWVRTPVGEGIVEEVGLRSTRIRTFDDTLITVPNSDVADKQVENCSAMTRRRILTHIQIAYGADRAQIEQIMQAIRARLKDDERVEAGSSIVFLDKFGSSSIELLVQCWSLSTNYNEFMATKEAIFLDVMSIVEEARARFAVPSQIVHLDPDSPRDAPTF